MTLVAGIPVALGIFSGVGGLLTLTAFQGQLGLFSIFLAVELYFVVAFSILLYQRRAQRDTKRRQVLVEIGAEDPTTSADLHRRDRAQPDQVGDGLS
jgi:hypothetical protein